MKSTAIFSAAVLGASQITGAFAGTPTINIVTPRQETGVQVPSRNPVSNELASQGCFSSVGNMTTHEIDAVSSGACYDECLPLGFPVMALRGEDCFCGYMYPPRDTREEEEFCHFPCPQYPQEACGNLDPRGWSVFNTGITIDVQYYVEPDSTSTSASAAPTNSGDHTSAPSSGASQTGDPSNDSGDDEDSGTPTAGIAAGVVGGVVLIAGIAGGIWFYMRRKRNAEIEEEHRRNAAVNAFISGSKPPSSSGISMTDSRLEPGLAHRRLSDGSIADNQDYSRKILRVTNA